MDMRLIKSLRAMPLFNRPAGLTDDLIKDYNSDALVRYQSLTNISHPDIRQDEVKLYLQIHRQVEKVACVWDKMDNLGRNEIIDCYREEQ